MRRIIITGKNSALPRVVSLPIGVGIDGTQFVYRATLKAHEELCPDCKGYDSDCERCEGRGIVTMEDANV